MNLNQLFENTQGVNEGDGVIPDPKYDHEPPAQESDPIPDDQESDPIPDDADDEQGVAEGQGRDKHYYLRNNIWRVMDGDELVHEYKPERYEVVGAKKLLARFDDEGYDVTHVISPMGTVTYLYGKPMDEGFDGEYDDEAGMAQGNLHTIARAAQGLLDTIDDQENLPEWVQEKIAKVEGMMVSAWDYLQSQEEQGIDPRQDLDEIGDTPKGREKLEKYMDKAEVQVSQHWADVHNKSHLPTDKKMAKRNAGSVAASNRLGGFGIQPSARSRAEKEVAEIIDYDTLNQLGSHPMAAPLAAAGGAAIGGAIGGGIKKTVDYFQKKKEQKAQARRSQQQGMAEGSSENKYSNLSNRGVNRGINRAGDDFNRMMDLDQVESPHYKTQHQQDTKQRLKTKPMAGPKGVLPEQGVAEGSDNSPVAGAITRRIMSQRLDLLKKYGPANVAAAIDDVAEFVGDTEEIGSSDVSGWVLQVERALNRMGQGLGEAGGRNYHANTTGFARGARDPEGQDSAPDTRTWYIRLNGKLIKDKQGMPYSFRGKAAANKAAVNMQAKLFNKGKEFVLTTNPNDPQQGVAEQKKNSKASAVTEGGLGDQSLNALMQARQAIQQQQAAEIDSWKQDFEKNTAAKFTATQATPPAPVSQPGEQHSALRARLNMLDAAIKKQQQLDALGIRADKLGLLNEPGVQADLDTSMYVRDAARDNYATLNKHLDTVIARVSNRITQRQAVRKKPQAMAEDAGSVEAWGYAYNRRDQRVMWRKTFASEPAAQAWADQHNATILGMRPVQQSMTEGPFVQRIMHPGKVSIYVRSGKNSKLIATDIPYEILDKYIGKVIKKYPQFKQTDFSFRSSDKITEGLAQDEAEEYSGWRAELVNQITYNTFEVKMTNTRSKETANFIVRPVDMISHGPTLAIETMDVHDLQTGRTESWTKDDPQPDGGIVYAISGMFYDNKPLQKKLWNIVDTHNTKGQDMMPGLDQRRSIGQEVDADDYIDSQEKTQAAMAKMKKGMVESLLDEFYPGEGGVGPFKVYISNEFIEEFSTFDQAKEEIDFLRTADPKSFDADWKIIDGTGKTVWQHDPGEAIDAMRMRRKIQFNKPDDNSVAEGHTDDDMETTRQFRNAIAGVKAKSAIDKVKDGPGAKYYHDGAKVTPQETARRAAERKAQKDKKGVAEGLEQTPDQVRQTLNAWMNKDQSMNANPTKRTGLQSQAWTYIQKNINSILSDKGADGKGSYPASPYAAWLLVQHMDATPNNQSTFASQLEQARLNPTDGKDGAGKLQFLKDRAAVNQWILKLNDPKKYLDKNGKPLTNPTADVRDPSKFDDAGKPWTSAADALTGAINARNTLLVAAVKQARATTQPSYKQGVAEAQHSCPHCGGEMVSEELMNEKQDACYYKVKSRYKVWPSAYASGALVQCRKKGAKNWGNKSESAIGQAVDQVDENLRDWFGKDKWVRFGPDGKIRGDCARGDDSEGKPKCLPRSKANALGKKGRASAASRKRRQDPDAERSGAAINVNTKKKSNEGMTNGSDKKEATFRIQKMLNKKFGANLDVDGIMGPLTLQSINKFMPDAAAGLADQPNRTTAVQGKKIKEESRGRRVTRSGSNETAVKEQN